MSVSAAFEAWGSVRAQRDVGSDPAANSRIARREAKEEAERARREEVRNAYIVANVCDDYYLGHVRPHRAKKGATEVRRMFDTMLGDLAEVPATQVTRSQAFDLIRSACLIRFGRYRPHCKRKPRTNRPRVSTACGTRSVERMFSSKPADAVAPIAARRGWMENASSRTKNRVKRDRAGSDDQLAASCAVIAKGLFDRMLA